ncbi:Hypothetical protein, putative [Bodo saltans]|uniref:Uncharacterized protein n=1 Tax=Bodo saltans TaxID=75058 RepID=A0A0S4JAC8_BODSA|nr:Hypothetical protein, putative [Bodo saltans]|eukprot:CUG86096.1 Hypothetical protein, putative [Bodo saltans]
MSRGDNRCTSVKKSDACALRIALRERVEQKQRAQRAQQRDRLLDDSRSDENYFELQCVGNNFGLNTNDPHVMDSLWALEEEIRAEALYQSWYDAAHSTAGANNTSGRDEEGRSEAPPEEVDWEEYYYSLNANSPA